MKSKYIIPILLLISVEFFAQNEKATPVYTYQNTKADKLYNQDAYMAANLIYLKDEAKTKDDIDVQRKLAEGFKLNGLSKEAEVCYSRYVNPNSPAIDILHYAQVLLYNGRCEKAVEYFNYYKALISIDKHDNLISSCDELSGFGIYKDIVYMNAEGINSKYLDFSPVYYKNGLVFTSGRDASSTYKITDKWSNKEFPDLYFAPSLGNGKFDNPELFSWNLKTKYNDGAVSFSPDGNEMYYSSNNKNGKSKNGIKDLKIYIAAKGNEDWYTKMAFPFNSSEYATCHPAISPDGASLVFASDMPGGFGGMDLYISKKSDAGVWENPVNLGSDINTSGNEIFPFIDQNNQLFYSSDGLKGLGGLDIFTATKVDRDFKWITPTNLGIPFNSNKDDLCFISASGGREGYFTSNREGGVGEDDIYYWRERSFNPDKNKENEAQFTLIVKDKETKETLKDVRLNLFNESSESQSILTTPNGTPGRPFKVNEFKFAECLKTGYKPNHFYFVPEMATNQEKATIYLEKEPLQTISGKVLDNKTKLPIGNADVVITNLGTNEDIKIKSDPDGTYQTNLICNSNYTILSSKPDYSVNQIVLHADDLQCSSGSNLKKDLYLNPLENLVAKKELSKKYLGDEKAEFKEGRSFEIKDIYYDYDKFFIRKDAAISLDDLVKLLKTYPTMEIELSSHTDCRGTDEYNMKLSQERADAAVKYIISKDIAGGRIKSAGYGESMLKNNCKDGVNCTEEQHQENRRTEVKILRM